MNSLTQLVAVLFVLSLVCERVAEFLKNYLSEFSLGGFQISGDTITKAPPESPQELIRQYRILKLNIICGFATALLCHASIFEILASIDDTAKAVDDKSNLFGWPDDFDWSSYEFGWKYLPGNLWFLLGCFLTGAFISLGSKFWHDVLDILVATKDLKRMNSPKVLGEFELLSEEDQTTKLNAAIEKKSASWKKTFKNYRGVTVAKKKIKVEGKPEAEKLVLRFNVTKKEDFTTVEPNQIPPSIFFEGYNLPTDVVPSGIANASSGPIISTTVPRELGSSVGRFETGNAGTLGVLMVKESGDEKEYFGVSCFHVLFPSELRRKIYEINSPTDNKILKSKIIKSPSSKDSTQTLMDIGNVHRGTFNKFLDVAFFKTTLENVCNRVYRLGTIGGYYDVTSTDIGKLEVTLCGRTSGIIEGIVESVSARPIVRYFDRLDKFDHEFRDFIQVKMDGAKGDSGAAVLTKNTNHIIGIVVAIDTQFVYVMPARFILKNFPYEFITQNPPI